LKYRLNDVKTTQKYIAGKWTMKKLIVSIFLVSMILLTQVLSFRVDAIYDINDSAFSEQFGPALNLELDQVINLSVGGHTSAALTESGRAFKWGTNNHSQVINELTGYKNTPYHITGSIDHDETDKLVSLANGISHSAALTENGQVYLWGNNQFGQLGDGSTSNRSSPHNITNSFNLSANDKIIQVSLGYNHSSVLSQDGKVYIWGRNNQGQLGIDSDTNMLIPQNITNSFNLTEDDKVIQISMGSAHSSALTQNGKVFTWGINYSGQLGDNTIMTRLVPIDITDKFPLDDKVVQLTVGGAHSSALTESGKVFVWGQNVYGQLGDNTTDNRTTPTDITSAFPAGDPIVQLSMGDTHSSALSENGEVYLWGNNTAGQVGDDTTIEKWVPTHITDAFSEEDPVIQVRLGISHSVALTQSGEIYTWGLNMSGQLGLGSLVSQSNPTLIQKIGALSTLSFETNGGSEVSDMNDLEGAAINEPVSPSRFGYVFDGWYTDIALTNRYVFSTVPTDNITLYAKWLTEEYDITYTLDDGINHQDNPGTYHIETPDIALSAPSRQGYSFGGWYDNVDYDGDEITGISLGSTGDVALFAQWTINQYTLSFNTNGGSAIPEITQDYQTPIAAPSNPTKAGYTFSGWSQAIPEQMPSESIEFMAQWTINQYTISFITNGGSAIPAITQDYQTGISAPSDPVKEGCVFNGWAQNIPENMPAENVSIRALWIRYSIDAGDISTSADHLGNKIPSALIQGKDAEVIIKIREIADHFILQDEITAISNIVTNDLQFRRSGNLFLEVRIVLEESEEEDLHILELLEPLTFTIGIPYNHQGYKNYHVIRIHNGIAEVLDTQYDEQNQTLSFETDCFSTYVIAYDMSGGNGLWWLLLLLLIPLAYLIYRYIQRKSSDAKSKKDEHEEIETIEEAIRFEEVVIKNVQERPKYKAYESVENGDYLEITKELEASNHLVEVSTGVLPKLLRAENHFIPLKKEEVAQFKAKGIDLVDYYKLTPGSYTSSGYFMEVDLNNHSVENYVYTKHRLPPTTAKGHRWVRIESRRIKEA
jgi:uncharacterized repeat protein (TIGR02543 family)